VFFGWVFVAKKTLACVGSSRVVSAGGNEAGKLWRWAGMRLTVRACDAVCGVDAFDREKGTTVLGFLFTTESRMPQSSVGCVLARIDGGSCLARRMDILVCLESRVLTAG
jgi:hypothetical protein